MDAYSLDLRKKIVAAKERGMPTTEVARTFGVGLSSVKRYAAAAREGKPLAPKRRPALNPSWARRRGSSWRRTSKNGRRRRCPKGASSWRGWRGFR